MLRDPTFSSVPVVELTLYDMQEIVLASQLPCNTGIAKTTTLVAPVTVGTISLIYTMAFIHPAHSQAILCMCTFHLHAHRDRVCALTPHTIS